MKHFYLIFLLLFNANTFAHEVSDHTQKDQAVDCDNLLSEKQNRAVIFLVLENQFNKAPEDQKQYLLGGVEQARLKFNKVVEQYASLCFNHCTGHHCPTQ